MAADELARRAREFGERVQRILNTTICRDIRISAVVTDPDVVLIGYGLGRSSLRTARFPVLSRRCWLDVGYRLRMDEEGRHLTVAASFFSVFAADDDKSCLCRFDYERGKGKYPEAHLQVYGESQALGSWTGTPRTRQLDHLHFPVGGRRFRPTLEDVVEFLITEGLAVPRDEDEGWRDVLEAEREEFRQIQLRAAIRRDPETAQAALRSLGLS